MITFDDDNLFESGPARLQIGGQTLRHASEPAVDGRGVQIASQGTRARSITQHGTLTADTPSSLRDQRETIEAKLDGLGHTLIDATGQPWSNVVMLRFEPGQHHRLGPRWQLTYRIEYLQLLP